VSARVLNFISAGKIPTPLPRCYLHQLFSGVIRAYLLGVAIGPGLGVRRSKPQQLLRAQ
jgi:hypothetical protein